MKNYIANKCVQPLANVARRYVVDSEYATFAAAYVALLAVRNGTAFPLPELSEILATQQSLPKYVRAFLEAQLVDHWSEYQRAAGALDEEVLVDFFSDDATLLLMENKRDFSTHPLIDQLCIGLLDIKRGNNVADFNCGIGKFVRRVWFALWDAAGSDEGLSVAGYSSIPEFAAIAFIMCKVTEVGAAIFSQSIFLSNARRYDRIMLITPFGMEARNINIPMAQQVLSESLEDFPPLRLLSAEWVFAARAASLLAPGGRAVVAVPANALNGSQSQPYREYLVRNRLIEAVVSIPSGFLNGTQAGFALVVLRQGGHEIKFVNGEEYARTEDGRAYLDVVRLLKDYRDLNDYEAVTTRPIEKVFERECNLNPDDYLGEDLAYNDSHPFGAIAGEIRRGAKLSAEAWRSVEGDATSPVKKVVFKSLGNGLVDEELPGLSEVPAGAESAVLEAGDLLISRMGSPFKVAVVEPRAEKLVADENIWIVRMGGNKTLAYYLRAYLESAQGSKWLARLSTGASVRTISSKNVARIPVPDESEKARARIAGELEKMTILVGENRKRLNESLVAMKNVFVNFKKDGEL